METLTLTRVALAFLLLYFLQRFVSSRRRTPLPPGPKGIPFLGNVLQWPSEHQWLTFTRWGDIYGDLVFAQLFGKPVVIINSAAAAFEMLDKKGAIYAGRPVRPMLKLATMDGNVSMAQYGPRHRALRAIIMKTVWGSTNAARYADVADQNAHRLLRRLARDPSRLLAHVQKTAASIILDLTYGYEVDEGEDAMVDAVIWGVREMSNLVLPKAFLVDTFPALRYVPEWVPGAGFQKIARKTREHVHHFRSLPYDWTRKQMAAGTARPSFTSERLSDPDITIDQEELIRSAGSSLLAAGFETTVSSLYTFFLAMTLYPAVQERAQGELDAIVRPACLPLLADRERLPYVSALVKEVLRWQPATPQALPHRACEEDIQNGYRIPKDSTVIPNVWKFLHDPEIYVDPLTFDPSRFIDSDGHIPERDPADFVFGFGRRLCPGLHLAQANIFVACAQTLSVFNIRKARGADGCEITPLVDYTSGVLVQSKEFLCNIRPRSVQAEAIVRSS